MFIGQLLLIKEDGEKNKTRHHMRVVTGHQHSPLRKHRWSVKQSILAQSAVVTQIYKTGSRH
jgi:hypothetical protein